MYRSNKDKIIAKLRQGYTPIEISPKKDLSSTFKNIFKPIVKRKDLDFFFELYNVNHINLKAWSFLGIYQILEERKEIKDEDKATLHKIILDLLSETHEISYYGGSVESRAPLREHHITRVVELDNSLIFKPALEYINSFNSNPDIVIMELLEHVLSKSSDNSIEDMILKISHSIDSDDIRKKISIVRSLETYSENGSIQRRGEITELFKEYLDHLKNYNTDNSDGLAKKRELKEDIFKVGAKLELRLEKETLTFINSLKYPYSSLDIIASNYKNNQKFQSILLKKLQETENPHLIVEILKAILVLNNQISNWKDLVIENVMEYQLIDADLIKAMETSEMIKEKMLISLLNKADDWSLKFLREYLILYPNRLLEWNKLKNSLIEKLKIYNPSDKDSIIKFILSLIIDLEVKAFLEYSLETFKRLENDKLKKMAIFPILKFGEENLLLKLKKYMKENQEAGKFVMQFLNRLERNEWRFYY